MFYDLYSKVIKHGIKKSFSIGIEIYLLKLHLFMEKARYNNCLRKNIPYFGRYMAATQGDVGRHYFMKKIVELICSNIGKDDKLKILEIGSWAGGSAITLAESIKLYNRGKGKVYCIDPWISYIDLQSNKAEVYKIMDKAFKGDAIFKLFLHNVRATNNGNIILPMRGRSDEFIDILKSSQFDLVYIDGDHSYKGVFSDLINASVIVRDGGVLCGDDLELQHTEIDIENAKLYVDTDFLQDIKTGAYFHPGVTLAVFDFFQKHVSSWHGFWAVRKNNSGSWENIELDISEFEKIDIPRHFNI